MIELSIIQSGKAVQLYLALFLVMPQREQRYVLINLPCLVSKGLSLTGCHL